MLLQPICFIRLIEDMRKKCGLHNDGLTIIPNTFNWKDHELGTLLTVKLVEGSARDLQYIYLRVSLLKNKDLKNQMDAFTDEYLFSAIPETERRDLKEWITQCVKYNVIENLRFSKVSYYMNDLASCTLPLSCCNIVSA